MRCRSIGTAARGIHNYRWKVEDEALERWKLLFNDVNLLSISFIDYNKWRRKAQLVEIYKKLLNFLLKRALSRVFFREHNEKSQTIITHSTPSSCTVNNDRLTFSYDLRKQIPALLCNRLTCEIQGQNGQNVVKMAKWQAQQRDIGRLPRHMCVNFRYQ